MLLKDLKRIEQLSIKGGRNDLNPDEERELKRLKEQLYENGGIKSGASGLVVASNYRWLYKPYMTLREQSQIEPDDVLEANIYWDCVKVIEGHVKSNGLVDLTKNEQEYYRELSNFLSSGRCMWTEEPVNGKWMLLKGKLKSTVSELLRGFLEQVKPTVGNRVEDRVEPLFNKIMKQLNADVDAEGLSVGEKIKVMEKLSGLLADMKGERKQPDAIQVTHNNVFNVIMENKKEAKQLQRAAVELREGDGYELM